MIVEERMYTFYVGKVSEFLKVYECEGLPILKGHLGSIFGYFINEVGPQNMIVLLWAFESFEEREKSRAALAADPAWQAYLPKVYPLIMRQETRIMRPSASFAPILKAMLKAGRT